MYPQVDTVVLQVISYLLTCLSNAAIGFFSDSLVYSYDPQTWDALCYPVFRCSKTLI